MKYTNAPNGFPKHYGAWKNLMIFYSLNLFQWFDLYVSSYSFKREQCHRTYQTYGRPWSISLSILSGLVSTCSHPISNDIWHLGITWVYPCPMTPVFVSDSLPFYLDDPMGWLTKGLGSAFSVTNPSIYLRS